MAKVRRGLVSRSLIVSAGRKVGSYGGKLLKVLGLAAGAAAGFGLPVSPGLYASAGESYSGSAVSVAKVQRVRNRSGLTSSVSEGLLDDRLTALTKWVVGSYLQSGPLKLLSDAPDALNGRGRSNVRLKALQQTFWLQDNVLYGAGALAQYSPTVGQQLSQSWRAQWQQHFPNFCPITESSYVVGQVPQYDQPGSPADPRCRLSRPGDWQFLRMQQYPQPSDPGFNDLPKPIIGTDYPADSQGRVQLASIGPNSVRDLLKYGCLRQVMLGHKDTARRMFRQALLQWDGGGFKTSKNSGVEGEKFAGIYWTRDIAFALMCANALDDRHESLWPDSNMKTAMETRLWASQAPSGAIWTNYCVGSACTDGYIPSIAKATNEIGPLVLLAYGANIW